MYCKLVFVDEWISTHCYFFYVLRDCLIMQMPSQMYHKWVVYCRYESLHVPSGIFYAWMTFHMNNKKTVSLRCELLHVAIDILYARMTFHILYMWNVYHKCVIFFRKCLYVNDFPNVTQLNCFSSVCRFMWCESTFTCEWLSTCCTSVKSLTSVYSLMHFVITWTNEWLST